MPPSNRGQSQGLHMFVRKYMLIATSYRYEEDIHRLHRELNEARGNPVQPPHLGGPPHGLGQGQGGPPNIGNGTNNLFGPIMTPHNGAPLAPLQDPQQQPPPPHQMHQPPQGHQQPQPPQPAGPPPFPGYGSAPAQNGTLQIAGGNGMRRVSLLSI